MRDLARALVERYLDKAVIISLLLVTLVAGEHMLIVGPPGTAKSALIRGFARAVDARYFEYLLTRFSEPNEIFGPVDIQAFREGTFLRRGEAMLPDAEIVFLDEIFKSNSAILNALLSILNERRFFTGSATIKVPLGSLYGATNEVPNDDALSAIFDRFLVRTLSDNLDSFHFHGLVERGLRAEAAALGSTRGLGVEDVVPLVSLAEIRRLQGRLAQLMVFSEEFLARYKGLIFQIRSEGVSVSDRRIVKLLKLFAASALIDGRPAAHDGDYFVLRHVWNSVDQIPLLEDIVGPVLEKHHREHPEERRVQRVGHRSRRHPRRAGRHSRHPAGRRAPLGRPAVFAAAQPCSDLRAALQTLGTDTAQQMAAEVDEAAQRGCVRSRRSGAGEAARAGAPRGAA